MAHEHKLTVVDSRRRNGYRYRRYSCEGCDYRHTTIEILVDPYHGRVVMMSILDKVNSLTSKQVKAVIKLINVFLDYK